MARAQELLGSVSPTRRICEVFTRPMPQRSNPPCLIIVQGVLYRILLQPPHRSFSGVARAELQPRVPPLRPLPPLPRRLPSGSLEARVPPMKVAVGLFHPSHAQSGRSGIHLKLQPWRADLAIPWPDMQEDAGSSWSMSVFDRFSIGGSFRMRRSAAAGEAGPALLRLHWRLSSLDPVSSWVDLATAAMMAMCGGCSSSDGGVSSGGGSEVVCNVLWCRGC